ncbi:MAG: DUF6261 family protein [Bacteroidales bacterium]|jgi:hypothetical protein|nr:DUF6261 family protein [Bacteroidales bacterium]
MENDKLLRVRTTYLPNDSHFSFHKENEEIYDYYDPNLLGILVFIEPFKFALRNEDEALEYIYKSAETERIVEVDMRFDNSFEGMRDNSLSFLKHPGAAERYAAQNLEIIFNQYGNIGKYSYRQELTASHNLLQELRNHEADIKLLKLEPWIDAHEDAAKELATLLDKRINETAQKSHLKVRDTRQAVDMNYQLITDRIDAMINIHGKDYVPGFFNKYNAHAQEYKNSLAQHLGRIRKNKDSSKEQDDLD